MIQRRRQVTCLLFLRTWAVFQIKGIEDQTDHPYTQKKHEA